MEQIRILRYKFGPEDDPYKVAQNLVDYYKNAVRDGIHFDGIELRILDKDREYQIMGKIYNLDSAIYRMIEVVY